MKQRRIAGWIGVALVLAAVQPVAAGLLSKRYEFRDDVVLEVGASTGDGLRLDSVRFRLPRKVGDRVVRSAGQVKVAIAVSNTSDAPLRAGLAVALFDLDQRLLGVASGGNKLAAIKPGRQKSFELVFDGVNAEAHRSATFHVSLETKP